MQICFKCPIYVNAYNYVQAMICKQAYTIKTGKHTLLKYEPERLNINAYACMLLCVYLTCAQVFEC